MMKRKNWGFNHRLRKSFVLECAANSEGVRRGKEREKERKRDKGRRRRGGQVEEEEEEEGEEEKGKRRRRERGGGRGGGGGGGGDCGLGEVFYPGCDACDAYTKGCAADAMTMDARAELLPRDDMPCHWVGELAIKNVWLSSDAPDANTLDKISSLHLGCFSLYL
jgi:hypothetical protein